MLAVAENSLSCRTALQRTGIDPASFTAVRLIAGATVLALRVGSRKRAPERAGSWVSALALFGYAAAFSFAHASLPAAPRPTPSGGLARWLQAPWRPALVMPFGAPHCAIFALASAAVLGGARRCGRRDACKTTPKGCDSCVMSIQQ